MSTPILDRTKPFAEIHDATGSVFLEQDGNYFNMAGEPMGHTPQPTPPIPEEPVPPPERDSDEGEEDQNGTQNHEEHRGKNKGHHRGVARK